VRFSLLIEVQVASPTPASERQAFLDCVEQAVLADALGYDTVWAVEHHGLLEYSHSSAPEVLLAFIAARTTQIAGSRGDAHAVSL
jgi:alkanesulfonate monooxygenase SsuD/methylene tetrahydromethanopterin reductase-like flavin-dependent oxidoreductase (luciferase family)